MPKEKRYSGCAVCGESSKITCASGRCFCTRHATCGKCHMVLANGELQQALISLGSSRPDIAHNYLRAVKAGNGALGATLVAKAIKKMRGGAELTHGPGGECRVVTTYREHLPPRIGASHDCDASEVLSAAVN